MLQGVLEDRSDTAMGVGLDRDGAQTGSLQARLPMGLA